MSSTTASATAEAGHMQPEIRVMIVSPRNLATMESVIQEMEKLHAAGGPQDES